MFLIAVAPPFPARWVWSRHERHLKLRQRPEALPVAGRARARGPGAAAREVAPRRGALVRRHPRSARRHPRTIDRDDRFPLRVHPGPLAVEACAVTARGCGLPARADLAIALPMNGNVAPAVAAFPNPFGDIRSIQAAHLGPSRLRRRSPLARLGPSGRNGSADQPPVSARSSALESVPYQPVSRRVVAHRSVNDDRASARSGRRCAASPAGHQPGS